MIAMGNPVEMKITPPVRDLGGFSVRRALPASERRMVGPFIFFDHMGPVEFAPGNGIDVRPHPHINLATVTYLFEGELLHRDSLGFVQAIRPGEVNWMTAGRGIVHSERSSPEGRAKRELLHGIQSWVALPADQEEREPCFVHHARESLPAIDLPGASMRLIAGCAYGRTSPVEVFSEMFYLDAVLADAAELELPDQYSERAVYVVEGEVAVGDESHGAGSLLVVAAGKAASLRASQPSRVMLFGGEPVGERFIWWNFVSSRRDRIEQAKGEWRDGAFAAVPGETEHIPLPD
jgi:redox-sensitive bicupin YhaK (pirin superfamily)